MPEPITSPIPGKKKEQKLLSFPEALFEVILGKKVTKLEWDTIETYVHLADGFLCIHHKGEDETPHALLIKEEDLKGTDWVVINEQFSN